jgi:hypothetical protein
MSKEKSRGGYREGSGRKKGIETKILTIRVAASIHDELKALVKRKDAEFRENAL